MYAACTDSQLEAEGLGPGALSKCIKSLPSTNQHESLLEFCLICLLWYLSLGVTFSIRGQVGHEINSALSGLSPPALVSAAIGYQGYAHVVRRDSVMGFDMGSDIHQMQRAVSRVSPFCHYRQIRSYILL